LMTGRPDALPEEAAGFSKYNPAASVPAPQSGS
jgi:hypothetical protein